MNIHCKFLVGSFTTNLAPLPSLSVPTPDRPTHLTYTRNPSNNVSTIPIARPRSVCNSQLVLEPEDTRRDSRTSNIKHSILIHSSELESAWSLELGAFARCPSFKFDRQFNLGESRIHESTYSRLQDSRTLRVSCGGRQRRCVTST